jgi:hypothetical protein
MRLTSITFDTLVSEAVDTGKLAESLESAKAKREVTRTSLSQSGKAFTGSEGFKMARTKLGDVEDCACMIEAFDNHMSKAAKIWGLDEWAIPAVLLAAAKRMWPYRKVAAEKVEA